MEDSWLKDYENAKDMANECLETIQERNLKFPEGGPEASRMTATARRRLGTLGSLLDNLRSSLESEQQVHLTENERNRRRDLVTALKGRREQMLAAMKRDQPRGRAALLEGGAGAGGGAGSKETDATAELSSRGLVQLQQQVMAQQDDDLESLERTVAGTKHIALQINEETELHNRLLGELDEDVDVTASRLRAAQRRVKLVMRRSGSCKSMLLIFLLLVCLVVVIVIGFKIAIHLF